MTILRFAPHCDMLAGGDDEMNNEFETVSYKLVRHISVLCTRIMLRAFHVHNETELLLIASGECEISLRERAIIAKKGDVVLIGRNEPHAIASEKGAELIVVQFSHHFLAEYFPALRTTSFESGGADKRLAPKIMDVAESYFSGEDNFELGVVRDMADIIYELYRSARCAVLSEERHRERKRAAQRISSVAAYAEENFDGRISLSALAEREGITVTHLSHFIKDNFGMTFQEYIGALRFQKALRLIADERLGVYEVAVMSGYSDPKYLTKAFRERLGMTPAEYAKTAQKQPLSGSETVSERRYDRDESLRLVHSIVNEMKSAASEP